VTGRCWFEGPGSGRAYSVQVVQPETILGWHRAGFKAFWRWKFGTSYAHWKPAGNRCRPEVVLAMNLRQRISIN